MKVNDIKVYHHLFNNRTEHKYSSLASQKKKNFYNKKITKINKIKRIFYINTHTYISYLNKAC